MAEYRNWLLTEEAHIATLTLSRPHVMNCLTAETLFELRDITAYLRAERDVWVIIVQGQGKHFSTGMDIGEIKGGFGQSEQVNREHLLSLSRSNFARPGSPDPGQRRGFGNPLRAILDLLSLESRLKTSEA